ncbi:MAG: hypothetical protein KatS3mg009_0614 [Acidimicrobiia bacterium]|nr:MAG: hypothetical protein KatS3mg009_0614 [Acidimicrobiia bacterium]
MTQRAGPDDGREDAAIARALGGSTEDLDGSELPAGERELLDEYRVVLSHLPFDEVAPPPGLEERVVEAALRRRAPRAAALGPARRRRIARRVVLAVAAAAAAAIVAVLATGGAEGPAVRGRVEAVAAAVPEPGPGAVRASLEGSITGEVVLARDGSGALNALRMGAAPPEDHVLTLWLRAGEEAVLVGAVPARAGTILFEVIGDVSAVTGVALSYEPQGTTPAEPTQIAARATFSGS